MVRNQSTFYIDFMWLHRMNFHVIKKVLLSVQNESIPDDGRTQKLKVKFEDLKCVVVKKKKNEASLCRPSK